MQQQHTLKCVCGTVLIDRKLWGEIALSILLLKTSLTFDWNIIQITIPKVFEKLSKISLSMDDLARKNVTIFPRKFVQLSSCRVNQSDTRIRCGLKSRTIWQKLILQCNELFDDLTRAKKLSKRFYHILEEETSFFHLISLSFCSGIITLVYFAP